MQGCFIRAGTAVVSEQHVGSRALRCWVLDVARIKAHPCLKRVVAMLIFLIWGDEILRPRGHRQ